jgi:nucleotide-binding universal stress UspA family protein
MDHLKILIPTDFSVQSDYAYLMVKKIEEKVDTEIHFLHVMNVPSTVTMDKDGNVQTCGEIDVQYVLSQKNIAENKLSSLKAQYGNQIHTHIVFGKVTDQIISFSAEHSFDLIVMGTKGASGIKEKVSGSETQMVARKSNIPLLSLMCDRSDLVIKNILFVHDFKNNTEQYDLSLLRKFIKYFDTKVHQLHILDSTNELESRMILDQMDAHAKLNGIVNYSNHLLNDFDIENGVVHFNQMHEVDMVCIGTHGKGGLFYSSVTEKLINHLYKPIISFQIK